MSGRRIVFRDGVKGKALGGDERSHLVSEALAQVPPAHGISSVSKVIARDVARYQGDVPGSAGDPDFSGTGLDKFISTPACLKNGNLSCII